MLLSRASALFDGFAPDGSTSPAKRRDETPARYRSGWGRVHTSLVALCANRLLCAALGLDPAQTQLIDLVVLATVAACEGILLHAGFYVGCAVTTVMVPLALAFPGHERAFFSIAVVTAMVINLLTWSRWKSEVPAPLGERRPRR